MRERKGIGRRNKFGWYYPPGAANDPHAPYNQEEPPEEVEKTFFTMQCKSCGEVAKDLQGQATMLFEKKHHKNDKDCHREDVEVINERTEIIRPREE